MADWLSFFGNWASILGLLVSLWVLYSVWRLRSEFVSKARVPELLEALERNATNLSEYLKDMKSYGKEFGLELAVIRSNAKSLRVKVPKGLRPDVKRLVKEIDRMQKDDAYLREDDGWKVYTMVHGLITDLQNLQRDKQWS